MKKTTNSAILVMAIAVLSLVGQVFAQSPFTPGNLVVYRVGDGTATLANTGNAVFLDEYSSTGTLVQSIPMPTVASGLNQPLVASGTATSEGMLNRSVDGQFLVMAGYATTIPYASSIVSTTATAVPRVIGIVSASATINTQTALTDFSSGNNPRSVCSTDGTALWACGGANGVRYTSAGSTTSTQLSTTVTNLRGLNIFNNQLYTSSGSGAFRLCSVGTGVPTTSGQTIANLPGYPTTGSPYCFYFADLDAGIAGDDVVYVADDGASGGIFKYSKVGGSWVSNGSVAATSLRGLTGSVSGTTVTLYGSTSSSTDNTIISFVDASGYNVALSGSVSVLVSVPSSTKKAFRGIAFAPVATSVTAPTLQASNLVFSGISQTQMNVSWTNGNGSARIVKINTTSSFTAPVDNTNYTPNSVYSGSGEQVIYNGNSNTIPTVTGLSAGTTYYFQIWEYNSGSGLYAYCTATGASNPASQATAATATAPFVSSPTATSITATSAILGGNITADGGSPIIERGTVWSTSTPVTITDNKAPEGVAATGVFTHLRTGMPNNTLIYYAAYATNAVGTTLSAESSFTTLLGEPTNHVLNFSAVAQSYSNIVTTWSDNDGGQPAAGYLILANKTGIFTDPVDGVPVANYFGLNDSSAAVNVGHGVQTYNWYGLLSSTHFFFKIYPYTNSGTNIDYKTVPTAPATDATTFTFIQPVAAWTFDSTAASPNTPVVVAANFGVQANSAAIYADGTNGSSLWLQATELNAFSGTTLNDPREGSAIMSGLSYCPLAGGTGTPANGKSLVFKFSMSALQDATMTFATRWSGTTAFNNHQWAWSTDGVSFTNFGTNTAPTSTSFTLRTLDLTSITAINGAPNVYLKVTFTGATSTTSNNRFDNVVIRANAATTLPPTVLTTAATGVMETTATLNGTVNANNQTATVSFDYGTTTSYGLIADGVPATVAGGAVTPVTAAITGLAINTTYHFRAKATNTNGTTYGEDMTFTTSCPIPGQAGEISGPTEVCSNNGTYNYSVDPIAYATNYLWSLPSGASIVSGDGTNGITVQFAPGAVSGDMSVFGSNDCGDGDASNPLSVVVTEPVVVSVSIAASANPVSSGTPVTFTATPVNGGTTPLYTWKINGTYQTPQTDPTYTYVPANGDSIICFLFSDISCNTGNPATSNQILMTVSGPPADIIVTGALLSGQTECYDATNTITVAGTGTTFSVASGATATMIAGSKISYLPGTTVASGGHMHGYIAPTGPWCPAAPEFKVIAAEQEKVVEILDNTFRIYPNPTTGAFTVEREGDDVASPVQVEVISIMGSRIISNNFSNFIKQDFNILGNQPGVYFVKITSGAKTQTVKILLTR